MPEATKGGFYFVSYWRRSEDGWEPLCNVTDYFPFRFIENVREASGEEVVLASSWERAHPSIWFRGRSPPAEWTALSTAPSHGR